MCNVCGYKVGQWYMCKPNVCAHTNTVTLAAVRVSLSVFCVRYTFTMDQSTDIVVSLTPQTECGVRVTMTTT